MIVLVTGPPGAGKSFYAVRKIGQALDAGKPVATNVDLVPDTAERVARSNVFRWLRPGRRSTIADRVRRSVFVAHDVVELFGVRLRGTKEGRGVMVLDEAHVWLNSRNWSSTDRRTIITFFTQHRKLGWDVYLIVQDAEMIDKQVRALIEYEVILRNLKRARWFGILPFSPVNLFLAIWRWHGLRGKPVKRELYRLSWHRWLYNTNQIHGEVVGEDGDVIYLPHGPGLDGRPGARPGPGPTASSITPLPSDDHRPADLDDDDELHHQAPRLGPQGTQPADDDGRQAVRALSSVDAPSVPLTAMRRPRPVAPQPRRSPPSPAPQRSDPAPANTARIGSATLPARAVEEASGRRAARASQKTRPDDG